MHCMTCQLVMLKIKSKSSVLKCAYEEDFCRSSHIMFHVINLTNHKHPNRTVTLVANTYIQLIYSPWIGNCS